MAEAGGQHLVGGALQHRHGVVVAEPRDPDDRAARQPELRLDRGRALAPLVLELLHDLGLLLVALPGGAEGLPAVPADQAPGRRAGTRRRAGSGSCARGSPRGHCGHRPTRHNGGHADRHGRRAVRRAGRPGARRHPRRAGRAGAQRRGPRGGRAAGGRARRPARAVRRGRPDRARHHEQRPAARPDLHLPRPAARLRRVARTSWSRRSGSPSCTRWPTTSASTTTACTSSATPEASPAAQKPRAHAASASRRR